ncbi:MAG: GAF domain-containing protein, partial [Actinomycetes bacterium]
MAGPRQPRKKQTAPRAADELRRANRALQTIIACNHLLVRAADEAALLDGVCRLLVEQGGYRMAWVGFAEQNAARSVRPVAQCGFAAGYLDSVDITWADRERGRGPTGLAIRGGRPVLARSIPGDPAYGPWREAAVQRGYASSIALPLQGEGRCFGAFDLYAAEPDAFDPEEVELLAELADDLAYGIGALRQRVQRERAEEALTASEEKYRLLVDSANEAIVVAQDGVFRLVNRMTVAVTGFSEQELTATPFLAFIHPEDRALVAERYERRLRGEAAPARYAFRLLTKEGGSRWVEINTVAIDWEGRPATLNFLSDITERKRAEESAAQQSARLRLLYDAGRRLNSTLDLHEIYQVICDSMSVIAPNDGFFISAYDQETQLITCHACWMEGRWLDVGVFPPIPLEEAGKGTQSIVIRTGHSMVIDDYQARLKTAQTTYFVNDETDEIVTSVPLDEEDVTRSALIVPLKTGGVVHGVIQVMSGLQDAYTEDHLELLEALALHIASAEQNALLYAQVQTELSERKQAEEELARSAAQLREQLRDTVRALGAIVGLRDPYTAAHERRVAALAAAIAAEMGLGEEAREGLAFAAEVHDIGKIGVPAEILSKPGALSKVEYDLIKQHPEAGRELLG